MRREVVFRSFGVVIPMVQRYSVGLWVVPLFRGIEVRGRSLCRSLLSRVAGNRDAIGICLCVNKP
jgi:hypothetical protein